MGNYMKQCADIIHDIENNKANQKQVSRMFGSSFDFVYAEDEDEERIRGIEYFRKMFNGEYYLKLKRFNAAAESEEEKDYYPFKYADELREAYESED